MIHWAPAVRVLRAAAAALAARVSRRPLATGPAPAPFATPPPAASPTLDRGALDRRFRGSPEALQTLQTARYLEVLFTHQPVVEVGCGEGGLLAALAGVGADSSGIDIDSAMVEAARGRGLDVRRADAVEHLETLLPGSVGSIAAIGLVEHLGTHGLVRFLRASVGALRPGGVLVMETPNPAALVVLGSSWLLDPTRAQPPVHPALLTFLCEWVGFTDVGLQFWPASDGNTLRMIDDPDAPPWADRVNEGFAHLNRVLFGPRDYSVTARAPAPPGRPVS